LFNRLGEWDLIMGAPSDTIAADIRSENEAGVLTLYLSGQLNAHTVADLWSRTLAMLPAKGGILKKDAAQADRIAIDMSEVAYCDGAGMGLILEIQRQMTGTDCPVAIEGLTEKTRKILELFPLEKFDAPIAEAKARPVLETIGQATVAAGVEIYDTIAFIGELIYEAVGLIFRPRSLRLSDTFLTLERAGCDALPILMMMGFLFGFVLALQAAIPMKMFGAEIFVADLVAISLLRELGPILTAIVFAGRSGSAFAAELGTMQVKEEIAALKTMGLAPVRFLALPRVIAGTIASPLLCVFCSLLGLAGGAVVMLMMGYPLVTYVDRAVSAARVGDLLGGLFKVTVFGMLVSAVGCMEGLRTGSGASAVGESTTRAVVASLVLIIVADGIFAVCFYYLGI
jgi:phospholipid/cholesterol/gamma-HCH transport system permease protein